MGEVISLFGPLKMEARRRGVRLGVFADVECPLCKIPAPAHAVEGTEVEYFCHGGADHSFLIWKQREEDVLLRRTVS